MRLRFMCLCLILALTSFAARAADDTYKVARTIKLGGEGGWDYVRLDDEHHLLYVTRSTHTMVVDVADGKLVADIPGSKGAHGTALAPDAGRGFISDGRDGSVIIFDLKTNNVLCKVAAAEDADGIIYDPGSKKVFVACGDAGKLIAIAPDVDPQSGKADASVDLGGKPEFLVSDGKGKVYVALVDKAEIAVVDTNQMKVVSRWPTAPGGRPCGMAMDREANRVFCGCRNQKLVVFDASADGKVIADAPIGPGVDAVSFDDGNILASCGDGTLAVIRETSPGKYDVVQTVKTAPRARTMAVDSQTHAVYLPTADMQPAPATAPGGSDGGGRPRQTMVPGSFKILVVERNG